MNSEYVLNILQERQLITDEQANTVRSQVADSSKDVAQLIVDTGASPMCANMELTASS